MILIKIVIFIVFIGITGCVSLNSHQDGKTLGKGNKSITGSLTYGSFDSIRNIIPELRFISGKHEKIDLGFKINAISQVALISKLQIIGNQKSKFASSAGVDLSLNLFASLYGEANFISTFSLYNSFHPNENLAITFTPKYNRFAPRDDHSRWGNDIYGYSVGFISGKKSQFSFELSQYLVNEKVVSLFSLGIMFKSLKKRL